jgi:hypothetical protein
MKQHREQRIPLPDMADIKAAGDKIKAKTNDAEAAVGGAILRHPKLTFWVLLVIALAGGKILAQLGR